MKKALFIILILLCISRELKAQYTWFQSYPTAIEVPVITLTNLSYYNYMHYYCSMYASATISYSGSITERGFVSSQVSNPTILDTKTIVGSGVGSYSSSINNLGANTRYYCRAYAIYGSNVVYSNQLYYDTNSGQTITTNASTTPVCGSTSCAVTFSGTITTNGNTPVTNGIYWGETSETINYQSVNSSTTSVSYDFEFNNRGTTIYFKAAAYDPCDGWVYGSVQSVYLPSGCTIPTVTTASITNITASTATSGGNVTNDGGCAVTQRGVQWSIYSDFSIIAGSTSDGTGTGSFASSLTGLNCGNTYYVRAYAINSSGTGYGSVVSFTTTYKPILTRSLYFYFFSDLCGTYDFTSSKSSACQVLSYWISGGQSCMINPLDPIRIGGLPYRYDSFSVGSQLYSLNNSPLDLWCVYSGSGWYIDVSNNTIVELSNGVIQSITSCP